MTWNVWTDIRSLCRGGPAQYKGQKSITVYILYGYTLRNVLRLETISLSSTSKLTNTSMHLDISQTDTKRWRRLEKEERKLKIQAVPVQQSTLSAYRYSGRPNWQFSQSVIHQDERFLYMGLEKRLKGQVRPYVYAQTYRQCTFSQTALRPARVTLRNKKLWTEKWKQMDVILLL